MTSALKEAGSTRKWRKIREKVIARDGSKCKLCGKRATHVDHIKERRNGGNDAMSNLRVLCRACNLTRKKKP